VIQPQNPERRGNAAALKASKKLRGFSMRSDFLTR
jgi:hypothetical protein